MEKQHIEYTSWRVAIWRFLSGAHLDGRKYTNATWTKKGTLPKAHATWWTCMPRIHRAWIRWAIIIIPTGWAWLFQHYHYWTTLLTLAWAPFAIHQGWHAIVRRIRHQNVNIGAELRPDEQNIVADLYFPDDRDKPNRKAGSA